MSIQKWSDNILIVELQDDPGFTDDMMVLFDEIENRDDASVVFNFAAVNYINSSNIAKLLKLRKKLITCKQKLVLCGIDTNVWGLFLVTGLDKVFEFADDVASGLAGIQVANEKSPS